MTAANCCALWALAKPAARASTIHEKTRAPVRWRISDRIGVLANGAASPAGRHECLSSEEYKNVQYFRDKCLNGMLGASLLKNTGMERRLSEVRTENKHRNRSLKVLGKLCLSPL